MSSTAIVVVDPVIGCGARFAALRQQHGCLLVSVQSRASCYPSGVYASEVVKSFDEAYEMQQSFPELLQILSKYQILSVHAGSIPGSELAWTLALQLGVPYGEAVHHDGEVVAPKVSQGAVAASSSFQELLDWAKCPVSSIDTSSVNEEVQASDAIVIIDPTEDDNDWISRVPTSEDQHGQSIVCVHSALFKALRLCPSKKADEQFADFVEFEDLPTMLLALRKYNIVAIHVGSGTGTELGEAMASALKTPCKLHSTMTSTPSTQASSLDAGDLQELLEWADTDMLEEMA